MEPIDSEKLEFQQFERESAQSAPDKETGEGESPIVRRGFNDDAVRSVTLTVEKINKDDSIKMKRTTFKSDNNELLMM